VANRHVTLAARFKQMHQQRERWFVAHADVLRPNKPI
jgi:hypothetical protein